MLASTEIALCILRCPHLCNDFFVVACIFSPDCIAWYLNPARSIIQYTVFTQCCSFSTTWSSLPNIFRNTTIWFWSAYCQFLVEWYDRLLYRLAPVCILFIGLAENYLCLSGCVYCLYLLSSPYFCGFLILFLELHPRLCRRYFCFCVSFAVLTFWSFVRSSPTPQHFLSSLNNTGESILILDHPVFSVWEWDIKILLPCLHNRIILRAHWSIWGNDRYFY